MVAVFCFKLRIPICLWSPWLRAARLLLQELGVNALIPLVQFGAHLGCTFWKFCCQIILFTEIIF